MKITHFVRVCLSLFCCFFVVEATAMPSETAKKKKNTKEHFYYALPENYFIVTLTVDKISTFKAPLADYAGKVTGLSSVVKGDAVRYSISEVKLSIHSQMDMQQVYYVEIPSQDISYRYLYKDLLLNNYADMMQNTESQQSVNMEYLPSLYQQNRFSLYTADDMVKKHDTTYIEQIVDTVVVLIPKITERLVAKPTQQQAQEIIKTIEEIREARWLLISGDHETDYTELQFMLDQLQKKEDEYLALFSGITEKEELTYTFIITPSKQDGGLRFPLFYFSDGQGLVSKDDDIPKMEYSLQFTPTKIQDAANKAKRNFLEINPEKGQKKGVNLYYRNPQYYSVSLYDWLDDNVIDFGVYPIAQFGETMKLLTNVHSFKIDSLTGALLYIETIK